MKATTEEQARIGDDSLLVDISDALSERDRVRFTVQTKTKLPQFSKQVMSVVRQHEEFVWLHDCLVDNDQYAGYIIPPVPPKPDFDASRERLQQLGDRENQMTKEEFAKMKQELEAEYLAIFKKTVAMHEIFLQRLAAHPKFRQDSNFKIFLEYENELSVRCKSTKEKLAGSIQNIGKSLTDFVITTSQVAASATASGHSILSSASTNSLHHHTHQNLQTTSNNTSNQSTHHHLPSPLSSSTSSTSIILDQNGNNSSNNRDITSTTGASGDGTMIGSSNPLLSDTGESAGNEINPNDSNNNQDAIRSRGGNEDDPIDEQYFEKERLFLALYYNSIRETAVQADRVCQLQKCVANCYLNISQNLIKLAGVEVVPVCSKLSTTNLAPIATSSMAPTSDSILPPLSAMNTSLGQPNSSKSGNISPSAQILPSTSLDGGNGSSQLDQAPAASTSSLASTSTELKLNLDIKDEQELLSVVQPQLSHSLAGSSSLGQGLAAITGESSNVTSSRDQSQGDKASRMSATGGCANDPSSSGLKQMLLRVSDYLEQAKKIETRIASDEDLKLTDTFLYYKHDTQAAQDLLTRRLRFMAEFEQATKNLDRARQKGGTQMQYAEVIQKQACENFVNISKLAKQELADYKKRRVAAFRKSFRDLAELQLKHLRAHAQLISNCLDACRG